MKKVLIIGGVIFCLAAIGTGAYYFLKPSSKYGEAPPKKDLAGIIVPPVVYPLNGKTFVVPNTENISVNLTALAPSPTRDYPMGQYDAGDGVNRGTLVALDFFTTENINGRRAVPIVVNQGGKGEFVYLAIMTDDGASLSHVASIPLGDRISVRNIKAEGSVVSVTYFVHDRGQAMAEFPTVETTAIIDIGTGQVIQAGRTPGSEAYVETKTFSGIYKWVETEYEDGEVVRPVVADVYTMQFSTNQLQLATDCNSGSATFVATAGSSTVFTVDTIAATKMFCESVQETAYFEMIGSIAEYSEADDGTLKFVLGDTTATMTFVPVARVIQYQDTAEVSAQDIIEETIQPE